MLCTGPDLAYPISQISQFSTNPSTVHETGAKTSLRYLNGTRNFGIAYDGSKGLLLEGYCGADYGVGGHRRSLSGLLFNLCGGAIIWGFKKQTSTAVSSTVCCTKSDHIYGCSSCSGRIHLDPAILSELREYTAINSNVIYCDDQGAISLANNPEYHSSSADLPFDFLPIAPCICNNNQQITRLNTRSCNVLD
jgi:hypothetical protein